MFLSRAAGDRLTSTLPPALRFRWMRPGARSRAQLRTAVTDTSMLLPVLRNNFITVMDALVFLEMLANPSIKPFSSPVLRAAASPPAFHPLPSTSQSLAAATRGSLGTWGRFVSTGAHVALGNGGSAHRIPARRAGSKSGRNTSRLAQGRLVATDGCKHSGTFAGPNPAGERGCCPGWGQDPGPGARFARFSVCSSPSRCAGPWQPRSITSLASGGDSTHATTEARWPCQDAAACPGHLHVIQQSAAKCSLQRKRR
ncbi:uncharacterized protein LOC141748877 isoform X2 [Larus michahellis]|uniref:uncharacterized protein LOC141748877 isoform X2 n=1 Tax=Larus michahellis TaxID=119627 RepID=UPI003D9B5F5E